jgi:hypothetical protein
MLHFINGDKTINTLTLSQLGKMNSAFHFIIFKTGINYYQYQRLFIIFLAFYSSFSGITAQPKFMNDLQINSYYHYGYVLPEYKHLLYVVEDNVQSAGLSISKKTIGKNEWQQLYNYPEYGIFLFYSTLGNNEVNGQEIAIYPFFSWNIFSGNRLNILNQIGIGLGYATRKFDFEDNYQNVAIGSNLNIHFNFRLGIKYLLLKKIPIQTGISLDHFSNANMKSPNLGLNYLTSYVGLGYLMGERRQYQVRELEAYKKGYHFEFIYSIGGRHTRALQTKFYFTSSVAFEFKWKPYRVFHLGIGTDLFYDSATESQMSSKNPSDYKKYYDYQSGIHLSQEFLYNRVSIIIQEGIYLFLKDKADHNIMYNRGIVRYTIANHIILDIAMKTHFFILDYPELGLGFKW